MKKIISWIMLVAMILGMFAGCGQAADPTQPATTAPVEIPDIAATSENNALDVINYLNAIYKDSGAKTAGDFQRFGIVRIAGVPYTVEWTVDVSADKVTVDVHDDGTVTINVNEKCTEDTNYLLTATVTDGNGNTESASWEYLLPGVASVEEMQAIVDQAYSLEVGEAMTETVSLYGVITSIDTPYSDQYQNITVTIQIEGREDKPIMCYRLKGEGAADLNPGDTISVQGIIKNYNNKIEFDAGCTINFVEKTGTPVVIPSDPHQILDDLYALGDNESLPYGPVTMTGRICSINTPYSDQYKNITVTIIVDWYTVQCYRLKGEGAESLEMNDIITVKGYMKKHNGTREFETPELLDVVKVGEAPKPSDPIDIVKTAYALDPGWSVPYGEVTLTGIISKVNTGYDDEFKNITVTMYIDNDVNKQYPIECYRMVSNGGENDEKIKDLKVNDMIVTKGVLMKYQSASGSTKVELNCPELIMVATYEEMVVRDAHNKLAAGEKFDDKHYINGSIDLADKQYITGSIKSIDKAYTAADGLTATVVLDYMLDDPIQCINIKGLNADKLKVGDKLTVVGAVSKAADGTVQMGPDCDYIPVVLPATVNPADNKIVLDYASKLINDQRMVDDTILVGKVTSIDSEYNPKYENVTLTIDVQGTKIQCYRLKGLDADWVAEGDEIIVGGYLTKYNNKIQFAEGCTFVMLKKGVPAAGEANTITFNNKAQRTEFTTTKQVWKVNGITVTNEKAASTSDVGDYSNPVRFYKNSSLTIEYPGMMQIVVNCDDYKDTYPTDLVNSITGATAVANGTVVTITFSAPVDSFTIPNLKGQVRVDSIKVSTEVTAPETPETPDTPDTPDTGSVYMTSAPKNGDKVVIVAPAYNKALSSTATGNYNAGVNVTASGSKLTGYGDTEIWTVIVNEDGSYSFQNGTQNIGMQASYTSMKMGAVNDDWALTSLGDGLFNIKNTVRGTYMEWYSKYSNWSTYGASNAATDDHFQLSFYLVEAAKEPSPYMTSAPKTGDKVVIVAPAYNKALSSKPTGNYNMGVSVTASGDKLTGYADTEIWTVTVNADGSYTFTNGTQNIGMQASYTSMKMGAVNDDWSLTDLGDGLFNIKNVVRGTYMEWYSKYSNWSTYGASNAATDDQFQLAFHLVEAGGGSVTPPPVDPEPETPSIYMTAAPKNGDKVVIVAPAYNKALSTVKTGNYNVGTSVSVSGNKLTGYADTEVFTVIVNDDGSYSFENAGKKLAMAASYSSMNMGEINDKWTVVSLGNNLFNIKNNGRGNYMEWYAQYSNWSTYNSSAAATDDQYQLAFYLVEGGTVTPPETPEATIAGPYKYYLEQKTNNKTLYFTGKMSGNYGAASENKDEGVDVYTETTAEGVRLYFMDGTTKTYLDCVKSTSGTKTYYNLKLVTTPTVYYKLHPTFNIYTTVVEGQEVYLGTYSTYDTFSFSKIDFLSASNIDVTQFPAKLGEGGTVTPPVTPDPDPEPPVTPPVTGEAQYVKVESAADFTTGKYVMVVSNGRAPKNYDNGSNPWINSGIPTITDGAITSDDAAGYVWDITVSGSSATLTDPNGVTVKPKGGNNNGISKGAYNWAWAFSGGTFTFAGTGSDTVKLACNTGDGTLRFRAYKNTTISGNTKTYPCNFTLYKLTEVAAEPELKVSTIKEALAATTGTELKITGYVNLVDGNKVYVQDATGAIRVDMASSGAKKGDTFTFTGTKAAGSVLTGTAAEAATPALSQFVTECPLYDVATEVHLYHYMNITSELTIIGEEGDYIIVADDEDNTIKIFDPVCSEPSKLVEGAVITFKGILIEEDAETYRVFKNTDASEITIVKEAPAPVTPPAAPTVKYVDFDTISSTGDSGYTKTYTTTSGWTVKNSAIQVGGPSVANPAFPVVGADKSSKAPCLNGKVSAPGSITSPTLTGGISKLNINYTKMFTDTTLGATITITDLSTGTTYTDVLSKTADKNTKYEIWYYEWTLPTTITGDFTITVVNNSPTGNTGNKDRLTILDLFWTTA